MASFKVGDPSVEQVPVVMAARKRGPGKSGASLNGRMDGTGKLPTEATWGQTCNRASCTQGSCCT